MPELPEVESARATIERAALGRTIADVDDTDTWECRPHAPGEIRDALLGRSLTGAFRRGKSMWCETSGAACSITPGPVLGLHLGMSGHILVSDPDGQLSAQGGDWLGSRFGIGASGENRNPVWDRFTLIFADGGSLRLFDKRRLGRVRLDPQLGGLGPDAELVGLAEFSSRVGRGTAPVKARLLDQSVVAGVGNLLADETLWQAKLSPRRPSLELSPAELATLHSALHEATRAAIRNGGVHTGELFEFRRRGRACPRCATEMTSGTVGGRTTWWCPREQV